MGLLTGVLLFLLRYDELWLWYDLTREKLAQLEEYILSTQQQWRVAGMIWMLFVIKCFVPIYPTSTVCFISGLVFPVYIAVPINIIGICIMYTVKYFWGFRFGGGMAWKIVNKVDGARKLIQQDGNGNPWLLTSLRLIPGIPINTVSSIYGSLNFGYFKYLLLSLTGFLPRLVSYTVVGRNAYDPLSVGFLLPLCILFILSAITLLSINGVIMFVEYIVNKTKK